MKKIKCQFTKEKWKAYKEGAALNPKEIKEMVSHFKTCSACREFAYQHSFYSLLKESYKGKPPESSGHFLTDLLKKLKEAECQNQQTPTTEILLQKGWKLVPVMTVLLLLLLGSFAYQYKNVFTVVTQTPIEEVILFDDTLLDENHILYAITTEELKNEK